MVVAILVGLVALTVIAALQWYVWRRVVRDTTLRGTVARRVGTTVFLVGPALMVAGITSGRAGAPFWLERVLAWPGYLWLALMLYLVLALAVGELVRPLLRRFLARRDQRARNDRQAVPGADADPGASDRVPAAPLSAALGPVPEATAPERPTPEATAPEATAPEGPAPERPAPAGASAPLTPSRRVFLSRAVAGTAVAAAAATVGAGAYSVLNGPAVKRVTVPLAKLPRAAHGFRIAVVSDIHLGPILGRSFAQRLVRTINSTQPDLIAIVGDMVDGDVADLGPAAEPLARLRAKHGTYFVTGNHEYFSGAQQWVDEVRDLGLHPMENSRVELPSFDLAGVNDPAGEAEGEGPDFVRALGDRDPRRASVLLAHQPIVIHDAVRHGVGLQLSGHTHGGQLWPVNYLAGLQNPTLAGLERYGDTQLYVTRGAGAWGPPVRVGAESDITVVELASLQA
ncbi:metallophosphoesterase [Streptomyces sp. NPDC005955]|uniref:metallophosphoesterase n=1 Tax=Streptomyces sp. NPDC005955 TaxID=3364738 RepID=UPI0036C448DE